MLSIAVATSRNEVRQKGSLNVSFVLEQAGMERIKEAGKKEHRKGYRPKGNRVEGAAAQLRVSIMSFLSFFLSFSLFFI